MAKLADKLCTANHPKALTSFSLPAGQRKLLFMSAPPLRGPRTRTLTKAPRDVLWKCCFSWSQLQRAWCMEIDKIISHFVGAVYKNCNTNLVHFHYQLFETFCHRVKFGLLSSKATLCLCIFQCFQMESIFLEVF